jgi:hypothetical protein
MCVAHSHVHVDIFATHDKLLLKRLSDKENLRSCMFQTGGAGEILDTRRIASCQVRPLSAS